MHMNTYMQVHTYVCGCVQLHMDVDERIGVHNGFLCWPYALHINVHIFMYEYDTDIRVYIITNIYIYII